MNLWSTADGTVFAAACTVLIFYGIRTDRAKYMLPAAMLLHASANASHGLLTESAAIACSVLLTACAAAAAFRCWRALQSPYDEKSAP
ncbi:MAG: hypothetical protein IJ060_05940 [Oscillospiraceae bacterium]|nr:hypothetical protein [Oscillospiraceae bacterium]